MHTLDNHGFEHFTSFSRPQGGDCLEEETATPSSSLQYPFEISDGEDSDGDGFVDWEKQSDGVPQDMSDTNTLQDDDSACEYLGQALRGLDVDGSDVDEVQIIGEASNPDKTHALPPGSVLLNSVNADGVTLRRDTTIELPDGDFILIKDFHKTPESCILLRGLKLRRNKLLGDMLPKKLNEVAIIVDMHFTYQDQPLDQCLITIPLPGVFCIRELICTNRPYPDYCVPNGDRSLEKENGRLVCRWKCFLKWGPAKNKISEYAIQRLIYTECTPHHRRQDYDLRREWQEGSSTPEPSHGRVQREQERTSSSISPASARAKKRSVEVLDLTNDDDVWREVRRRRISSSRSSGVDSPTRSSIAPVPDKPYSFADICSGGGGSTRGALMSGLEIRFCLDHWDVAVKTLRRNFKTKVMHKSIYDFLHEPSRSFHRVDILHVSYPCPTYSPAHTHEGKDDDANIATGFSIRGLLEKTRPRIVTLEQTSGIVTHHPIFFHAMIHQLTCMNFNVRAKILNFGEYDNAQARKRLIIIASCPGEGLPTMPEPTHGHGPGLKKPVTIADRMRELDGRNIPANMRSYNRNCTGPRFSPDQPLRQCITCNGGKSELHYSGKRGWTLAETAVLAMFPWDQVFDGNRTEIKRQQGNAFPPTVASQLFTHIVNHLRRSDALIPAPEGDGGTHRIVGEPGIGESRDRT